MYKHKLYRETARVATTLKLNNKTHKNNKKARRVRNIQAANQENETKKKKKKTIQKQSTPREPAT